MRLTHCEVRQTIHFVLLHQHPHLEGEVLYPFLKELERLTNLMLLVERVWSKYGAGTDDPAVLCNIINILEFKYTSKVQP
jgi:hypothetical protein